jgi:hypothetical protein
LVARSDAQKCVELIYAQGWRFLGFDSFTVTNEFIQPHLEWTEDWSRRGAPDIQVVLRQIASHPSEVTHYEFVFFACGLTIHSSRSRFAARLNSGVRRHDQLSHLLKSTTSDRCRAVLRLRT